MATVQIRFSADLETADALARALEEAFDEAGCPVTQEETPAYSGTWTVDVILFDIEPEDAIEEVRGVIGDGVELTADVLADGTNWIAMSEEIRRPVNAGRFFVHGSHDRHRRPANGVSLQIDAEMAFGTGHHATTWACLTALDRLLLKQRFERPLDLGTGTGVLAIALARVQRLPVIATDIDPVAVHIAKANAALNGVAPLVECIVADGMRQRRLAERAPYDLVVANILARPLMRLAAPISTALSRRATLVLSGLRVQDAPRVLSAYRMHGIHLRDCVIKDDWMALALSNGRD